MPPQLRTASGRVARTLWPARATPPDRAATRRRRPPELLLGAQKYGPEIDMWSVGCIFAELLTTKPVFPGKDEADQMSKIVDIFGFPNEATMPGSTRLQFYK
jgi:cyclin-dependent kinase 12/13